MAKQQIKRVRIDVSSSGAKGVEKELQGISSEINALQEASKKLGGYLKAPTKSLETLYKRSSAVSQSFENISKSAQSMNRAMSGNAKQTKGMESFLTNLEVAESVMKEVSNTAKETADNLGKVASTGTLASIDKLESVLDEIHHTLVNMQMQGEESIDTLDRLKDSVDATTGQTKKGRKAQERYNDSLKDTGAQADAAAKGTEGFARTNGRMGKNMSKMSKGGLGLAGTYAVIAANVYAVTEAFRLLGEAADTSRLIENLGVMGSQSGTNLAGLSKQMQTLSGESLNLAESSRLASRSIAQGFSSQQMLDMTEGAKKASIALGINFSDAMERLTKGIAKQEVELLDELGIVTRLEPAMKKYAGMLGKTVEQLTDTERTTALYTEAMDQLGKSYSQISIEATGVEVFTKAVTSAMTELGMEINKLLDGPLRFLGQALNDLMADPLNDVAEYEKLLTATLGSMQRREKGGGPQGAGRLANVVVEGFRLQETLQKSLELKRRQLIEETEGGANEIRQSRLKAEIEVRKKALVEAQKVTSTAAVAGGFGGMKVGELSTISKSFASLTSGSERINLEMGKFTNNFKGPISGISDAVSGVAAEFNSLQEKVLDNSLLSGDLYKQQELYITSLGAKFNQEFNTIGQALDYINELNEKAINLQTSKQLLELKAQKPGAVGAAERAQRLLMLEFQLLEAKRESKQISELEFKLQEKILDAKGAQVLRDKEAAPFKDASSMFLGASAISGLSSIQTTGLGMAETMSTTFAKAKESGMGFSEMLMSNTEAFMEFSTGIANAANSIFQTLSDSKISAIDREIEAEKRRDGKSLESLAKIKKLNAQKIREEAKAKKASVIMSTATAIMQGYSQLGPIGGSVMAAVLAAMGSMQLNQISKAAAGQLDGLNTAGAGMSITGGSKDNRVDVSRAATASEFGNLPGRAGGGFSEAGTSIVVGEMGPEVITPAVPINVSASGDGVSSGMPPVNISLRVDAIDSASFADSIDGVSFAIREALEKELQATHQSLNNL